MKGKRTIAVGLLILLTALLYTGCTGGRSASLLAENYRVMNDDQLLEHFYQLDDEIQRQEKSSGPSFGVGIGTFGRGVGGGLGVETGATGYTAEDLRKRRIEIRMELKRRNINP
jgi:hypothetical protein